MSGRDLARLEQVSPIRTRLMVSGLIVALYIGFATHVYYPNGVLFSLQIEKAAAGVFSKTVLFQPSHLFYNAVGYLLYRTASALGYHGRAISLLQGLNVVASVVTASLIYMTARRWSASHKIALFCLTLFAFGALWWNFSTDANSHVLAVLFATAAIMLLLESAPRLIPSGVCFVLAVLFDQLAIFLCVPAGIAVAMYRGWPARKRIATCCAYLLAVGSAILIAYWLAFQYSGRASASSIGSWILQRPLAPPPSGAGRSYFAGLVALFIGGGFPALRSYRSLPVYLALALCCGSLIAAGIFSRKRQELTATPPESRTTFVLSAWIAVYAISLAVWEPGPALHKLFLWPPIVLLCGTWIGSKCIRHVNALVALATAMAAWNFAAYVFPNAHTDANPLLRFAKTLDEQLPPSTHIYYSSLDSDDWSLEYFAPGKKWISLPRQASADWFGKAVNEARVPVCFETSALDRLESAGILGGKSNVAAGFVQRWNLVNAAHRIRFECLAP